jgi:hypothetical protein
MPHPPQPVHAGITALGGMQTFLCAPQAFIWQSRLQYRATPHFEHEEFEAFSQPSDAHLSLIVNDIHA